MRARDCKCLIDPPSIEEHVSYLSIAGLLFCERQNPLLHPPKYIFMFHHFQIFCLAFKQLIRVLAWLEHASCAGSTGVHLGHLLGHLGCR